MEPKFQWDEQRYQAHRAYVKQRLMDCAWGMVIGAGVTLLLVWVFR